jgi:phenylacetate-CoA ligase
MMQRSRWTRKRIEEYQLKRLRQVIGSAYDNVPHYHDKFRELGLNSSDVGKVSDLNRFPILRRKEIAENAARMISTKFNDQSLRMVSTSGSTGRPLFTYLSRNEDEFRKAKHLRANIAVGQMPRDKWVVVTAPQHFSEVTRLQRLLGLFAAIPLSVFDGPAAQTLALEKMRPDVLDGYSSSLFLLAQELSKHPPQAVRPKFLIGGAELIDPASRRFIEKSFDAEFYDQYATNEFERLAWQCKEKTGYHVDADSVIMQFVDKNGEEVAPGESGEIICTSLFNFAMPFIRYATGDIGRAPTDVCCPCGRTFPLMEIVEGRKDSTVTLPDGRVITALSIGWAMEFFAHYNSIEQYRVVQKRANLLRFIIKKKTGPPKENEMAAALVEHIRRFLNIKESDVAIDVEFTNEIPLEPTGKLRKVISELER